MQCLFCVIGHAHNLAISVQCRPSLWSRLAACYHPSPSARQRRSAGLLPPSTASWTAADMLLAPPLQSWPLSLPVLQAISRSGFASGMYMSITGAACCWLHQDVQWAGTKLWAFAMLLCIDINAWLYGFCYGQWCLSLSCLRCEECCRSWVISPELYLSQAARHL